MFPHLHLVVSPKHILTICFFLIILSRSVIATDVLTERYNINRTGSVFQASLNRASFEPPNFWRKLGELPVEGRVYAQPLYVENVRIEATGRLHNVTFIATSENNIYAFDSTTLSRLWGPVRLDRNDKSGIGSGCDGLSPGGIGIEATPTIDRATQRMFVSYRTNDSTQWSNAHQRLRAIDITSGRKIMDVEIQTAGFNVVWQRSRASLLLLNGVLYVAFGSRCEDPGQPVFHGWVIAYDANTLAQVGVFSTTPTAIDGAGIWQASTGLAADADGTIYFLTGNRRPESDHQPFSTPSLANSFVRLMTRRVPVNTSIGYRIDMIPEVWFTPYRRSWLDKIDLDLGSSGVMLIPGTRYAVGGGKQGILYLLNRDQIIGIDGAHANGWNTQGQLRLTAQSTYTDFPEDFSADQVIQKIQAGINQYIPAPVPGGITAVVRHDPDAEELFGVGKNGAIWTTCESGNGAWTKTIQITSPDFALAGAGIAAVLRNANREDVFFAGFDGAVWTLFKTNSGPCNMNWIGPIRLTPPNLVSPGAKLAVVKRNDQQEDLFFVDKAGSVQTIFVLNNNPWSAPIELTPAGFAPSGAALAAIKRNAAQEDLFVVDSSGKLQTLFVLNNNPWSAPIPLTQPNFAPVGANIAAVVRNSRQEDIFVVDRNGILQTLFELDNGAWNRPIQLTQSRFALPGGSVAALKRNVTQEDVFLVDQSGRVQTLFERNDGQWSTSIPLTQMNFSLAGAGITVANRNPTQEDIFGVSASGHPWTAWEVNDSRWQAPFLMQTGLPMLDWTPWPHIHGTPVFATFSDSSALLYVWPEKDHLKAFRWLGNRFDERNRIIALGRDGKLALAPDGMPGGMLTVSIDPNLPRAGIIFASLTKTEATDGPGLLRAFDAVTLQELWNNDGEQYSFSKFVPPTVANGRVLLATCSNKVLVYGK